MMGTVTTSGQPSPLEAVSKPRARQVQLVQFVNDDEHRSELVECRERGGTPLVAQAKSPKVVEPSESSFDDPPRDAESGTVCIVRRTRQNRNDLALFDCPNVLLPAVSAIPEQKIRSSSWSASRTWDGC